MLAKVEAFPQAYRVFERLASRPVGSLAISFGVE
jgi:hypothetical protein